VYRFSHKESFTQVMNKYILTLHEDANANVSLFRDTQIIFSAAEERFTRIKHQSGFPFHCLNYIEKNLNIPIDSIDVILCGNKYHPLPRILWHKFPTFEHPFLGISQKISLVYQDWICQSRLMKKVIESFNVYQLKRKFHKAISLTDHHTAHAYSAYMTSGFSSALVVTADNYGDGYAATVSNASNGTCTYLYGSTASHSPGQFYGELAQLLGFHPLMAGKMTGLAARGNPEKAYSIISTLFSLTEDKKDFVLPGLTFKSFNNATFKKLSTFSAVDIAAAAQKRFEDVIIEYIRNAIKISGQRNIALAGGIFGNVLLNQKIAELNEVERIWIHPGMSDQGISLGVGLKYLAEEYNLKPFILNNIYFGPEYSDESILSALQKTELEYSHDTKIERTIARLLAQGKVVARFNGKMEYGPRALGNRSILYQTTDPSVNDWLNQKLQRSEFMPFAPVTLANKAEKCYHNIDRCFYAAQFMTISVQCTEWMKEKSPGVVHVDGSARPQVLHKEHNPSYYEILNEYEQITGIPSLINTSFNLHGEPIVNTPEDAIRSFRVAELDYLAIGNYLVKHVAKTH
jgi:carbamoyltransferase